MLASAVHWNLNMCFVAEVEWTVFSMDLHAALTGSLYWQAIGYLFLQFHLRATRDTVLMSTYFRQFFGLDLRLVALVLIHLALCPSMSHGGKSRQLGKSKGAYQTVDSWTEWQIVRWTRSKQTPDTLWMTDLRRHDLVFQCQSSATYSVNTSSAQWTSWQRSDDRDDQTPYSQRPHPPMRHNSRVESTHYRSFYMAKRSSMIHKGSKTCGNKAKRNNNNCRYQLQRRWLTRLLVDLVEKVQSNRCWSLSSSFDCSFSDYSHTINHRTTLTIRLTIWHISIHL